MKKADLRTWMDVILHARERAARSLKRKDPVAYAYWRETEQFAKSRVQVRVSLEGLTAEAAACVEHAQYAFRTDRFMEGAISYSRAKWCVIVARANGWKMNPKKTGVNLKWLEASSRRTDLKDLSARVMLSRAPSFG